MLSDPLATRQRQALDVAATLRGVQAWMLASAGLMVVVGSALDPMVVIREWASYAEWRQILIASTSPMLVGALLVPSRPAWGRRLGLLGIATYFVAVAPGLVSQPSRSLAVVVGLGVLFFRLRSVQVPERVAGDSALPVDADFAAHPKLLRAAVVASSAAAIGAWFLVTATELAFGGMARAATGASFALAELYAFAWIARTWHRESASSRWFFAPVPLFVVGGGVLVALHHFHAGFTVLAMGQAYTLLLVENRRNNSLSLWSQIVEQPARLLVVTFGFLSLLGGVVLWLPVSAPAGGEIALIDAMFMAVSATCVSGLAVLKPGQDFSTVGQVALLAMVQLGGLAMMILSTAGVLLLGRRLGVRRENSSHGLLSDEAGVDLAGTARRVLRTALIVEGVGAVLLTLLFRFRGIGWEKAAWNGVFTSVTAFCNAGFTLFPDNLEAFRGEGGVLQVVAALIVLGGLGAPAIHAIPSLWAGRAVSLQARLVLLTTGVLLAVSFVAFVLLEWGNTLAPLPLAARLNNAWLLAVSPRTGGFHALDLTALHPASITLMMLLMFIGGSPFSTAGGAKTTTIALVIAGVVAALRGRNEATAFGRRISHESIYKSIAIMTLASGFTLLAALTVQLTQQLPFEVGLFEVVSALNTVGLSLGATEHLDGVGKVVIMCCMFAGRVGPVTLFLLLTEQRRDPKWVFPEEKVTVG